MSLEVTIRPARAEPALVRNRTGEDGKAVRRFGRHLARRDWRADQRGSATRTISKIASLRSVGLFRPILIQKSPTRSPAGAAMTWIHRPRCHQLPNVIRPMRSVPASGHAGETPPGSRRSWSRRSSNGRSPRRPGARRQDKGRGHLRPSPWRPRAHDDLPCGVGWRWCRSRYGLGWIMRVRASGDKAGPSRRAPAASVSRRAV
jgi:hypothetical protein